MVTWQKESHSFEYFQCQKPEMTNWIPYPTTLEGQSVKLLSLDNSHIGELGILAKDKRIWEFYTFDGTDTNRLFELYSLAISEREKGTQFPFVIFHKTDNRIIGSTRYLDIFPKHKKLEIGSTWLHPTYWATEINLECKLLLLTYCFEELKAVRVQLKTDENNIRSRKAIEKIGGQFEGVLRNEIIRDNGTKRNSAIYSIIDEEWTAKKERLIELFTKKMAQRRNNE
jgi:RimJ/RimL family protein N-acetyltransferase